MEGKGGSGKTMFIQQCQPGRKHTLISHLRHLVPCSIGAAASVRTADLDFTLDKSENLTSIGEKKSLCVDKNLSTRKNLCVFFLFSFLSSGKVNETEANPLPLPPSCLIPK